MRQYGADGRRDKVGFVIDTLLNNPILRLLSLRLHSLNISLARGRLLYGCRFFHNPKNFITHLYKMSQGRPVVARRDECVVLRAVNDRPYELETRLCYNSGFNIVSTKQISTIKARCFYSAYTESYYWILFKYLMLCRQNPKR